MSDLQGTELRGCPSFATRLEGLYESLNTASNSHSLPALLPLPVQTLPTACCCRLSTLPKPPPWHIHGEKLSSTSLSPVLEGEF